MTDVARPGKKGGRPRKADGPKVNYQQLDRLLVFGELVESSDGEPTVVFPSYRVLAKRFGVSHSVVSDYAKKHDCLRRRAANQARVEARTEEKLVELRATAVAVNKERTVAVLDRFVVEFEKALDEGRVRADSPADLNTVVRLKEFLLGGADSRQEVHAALSLEDLQARHREMLKAIEASTEAERGSEEGEAKALPAPVQEEDGNPPNPSPTTGSQEVNGRLAVGRQAPPPAGDDEAAVAAHVGPSGDEEEP
ncbi:MAG TPA: hypothetical protein PLI95_23010 [Polyangiaceae bacterium]|nr:hypothetical protein [Polyangiaceae bacterium]